MKYQSGFGNHFESEAQAGTLPRGQNSPKTPLKGLVPEQISGSAFTMARSENLRSWFYRIHPSTAHGAFSRYEQKGWKSEVSDTPPPPDQFRWSPLKNPAQDCDFLDGVTTMVATAEKPGVCVHHYAFNKNREERFFYNADGELLLIPQSGSLSVVTEMGTLEVEPQEIAVIPRGVKFQVNGAGSGWHRGYLGENTGHPFVLPNLGPLGANGLANPRDFLFPEAQFFQKKGHFKVIGKFAHHFWQYDLEHHPCDVVAWHGNYAPYKYDLRLFNTMGTVSYDHPDPSIYTVLTSPSTTPGQANVDFVIFPPRWLVAEETFRPPYYHRNIMSEYMGLIHGEYDAKTGGGFEPGGASLHNSMSAHGPDTETFFKAIQGDEAPQKIDATMAFMLETCHVFHPSEFALQCDEKQNDYQKCWQGFEPLF
ncbi:MAG: homogentisate 1,2-dioxygenase [Pseudomonadota bacterium]